jgi:hypothetical protein
MDYPGSIRDYTYNENASTGSNQWWTGGAGTGATAATGSALDTGSLEAGFPLLEGLVTANSVSAVADLNNIAKANLSHAPVPLVTHIVDLAGESMPEFGSYGLGDYLIAYVTDPRFSTGTVFNVRVIGWTIAPPDEGAGTEAITLVFDEPTGGSGGD